MNIKGVAHSCIILPQEAKRDEVWGAADHTMPPTYLVSFNLITNLGISIPYYRNLMCVALGVSYFYPKGQKWGNFERQLTPFYHLYIVSVFSKLISTVFSYYTV